MALISAKTILTSVSLFHITLGFFFLTNPLTIADQALVYIIGEAMGMVNSFSVSFSLPCADNHSPTLVHSKFSPLPSPSWPSSSQLLALPTL